MYNQPIILPLDIAGTIYSLQDEKGRTIGTGSREVCEVLLHVLKKHLTYSSTGEIMNREVHETKPHNNIRSALTI